VVLGIMSAPSELDQLDLDIAEAERLAADKFN
jgi:hypothetical protein